MKTHSDSGAVYYILALLLVSIIGMLSYTLNMGNLRALRSDLQNMVDSAAQVSASTLCSTEDCYNEALKKAKTLIREKFEQGRLKSSLTLEDQADTHWSDGDTEVTIRRGRWWSDRPEDPSEYLEGVSGDFLHQQEIREDIFFEDFDLLSPTSSRWQDENTETPHFFVANAVYIKVRVDYKHTLFNIFQISETPITAEVYALAGEVSDSTCAAPFALPVCALLNEQGRYEEEDSCLIERHFTESKRYCSPGNDCDVLPGTHYVPFPHGVERVQFSTIREHYRAQTDIIDGFHPDTNTSLKEYVNVSCDFETRKPRYQHTSNYFGVVGIPNIDESGFSNTTEANVRAVIRDQGCIEAKIGDTFSILHEGLQESASDVAVWDTIRGANLGVYDPAKGSESVPYSEAFERSIFNIFFPKNEALFRSTTYSSLKDVRECVDESPVRVGVCNSKRFRYDTACMSERGYTPATLEESLYTPEILPCPIDAGPPLLDTPRAGRMSWFHSEIADTTKVWKVAVPVISTASLTDRYCQGLMNQGGVVSDTDPTISDTAEYYIIGFVDMIFYDADIGNGVPVPLSTGFDPLNTVWQAQWEPAEEPWGFNQGFGAAGGCNLIKGMMACQQGLLSTNQFHKLENRDIHLIVPK